MEFRILGTLEVAAEGRPLELRRAKPRAVLAMLLLHRDQVVSVDRLIDGLWSKCPPPSAANTLQGYISHLRQVLAGGGEPGAATLLRTQAPGYRLAVGPEHIDACRFERLAAAARRALRAGEPAEASARFGDGFALWRGPALEDFRDLPFATGEAGRLDALRLDATEDHIDAELALGHHRDLASHLQVLVDEHPLRERLWGQLMVALYRCGRQSEALRAYQRLRAHLGEELGIGPSSDLSDLEEAMILQKAELDWVPMFTPGGDRTAVPASAVRDDPLGEPIFPAPLARLLMPSLLSDVEPGRLVGRQAELDRLRRAWAETIGGRRRLVWIVGEAGVGKTRLACEFARSVFAQPARVLYGPCDEDSGISYQPVREALRFYVAHTSDGELRTLTASHGADLALLVPELAERLGAVGEPATAEPQVERYRLFQAVDAFLSALSQLAPLLLFFDDLHLADQPTLLLVRHIVSSSDPARLCIVATYRDTELQPNEPLSGLVADMLRMASTDRLLLRGLAPGAVHDLIAEAQVQGLATNAELVTFLSDETSGNPLFIRELLRHFGDRPGLISKASDQDPSARLRNMGIPPTVKDVIAWRLVRLPDHAQRSLEVAAVLGREFDAADIAGVNRLPEDDLVECLEAATRAGLIGEIPAEPGRYQFAHGLTREALYENMSGFRRARLHREVASYLEALPEREVTRRVGEVANHFFQAPVGRDRVRAIAYAQRAAQTAYARRAYEEAVATLERAVETARAGGVEDDTLCDLLLALGAARWAAGVEGGARNAYGEAVELARRLRDSDKMARAAVGMAGIGFHGGVSDDAVTSALEGALGLLGPSPSSMRVRSMAALARALRWTGDCRHVQALTAEAVAMGRAVGDQSALANALSSDFLAHFGTDPPRCADAARELMAAAEACGDLSAQIEGRVYGLMSCLERCDRAGVTRELLALRHFATESRQPLYLWYAVSWEAAIAVMEGRFADGQRLADEGVNIGFAVRGIDATFAHIAEVSPIRWAEGRISDLLLGDSYLDLYPAMRAWETTRVWILATAGHLDQARLELDRIVASGLQRFDGTFDAPVISFAFLSHTCFIVGAREHAARLYERLLPYSGYQIVAQTWLVSGVYAGAVNYYLGGLANLMGEWGAADNHFDAALESHRVMGARPWLGWTMLRYGVALVDRCTPSDLIRGIDLLENAVALAREVGMPQLEHDAALALAGTHRDRGVSGEAGDLGGPHSRL